MNRPAWLGNGISGISVKPERTQQQADRVSLARDNETYEDICSWQHERITRANRCTCRACTTVDRVSTMQNDKTSDHVMLNAQNKIKAEKFRTHKRRTFYKRAKQAL